MLGLSSKPLTVQSCVHQSRSSQGMQEIGVTNVNQILTGFRCYFISDTKENGETRVFVDQEEGETVETVHLMKNVDK